MSSHPGIAAICTTEEYMFCKSESFVFCGYRLLKRLVPYGPVSCPLHVRRAGGTNSSFIFFSLFLVPSLSLCFFSPSFAFSLFLSVSSLSLLLSVYLSIFCSFLFYLLSFFFIYFFMSSRYYTIALSSLIRPDKKAFQNKQRRPWLVCD